MPPGSDSRKDREFERLQALYSEVRTEIRQRITQRDQYSIQLTVALAAIIAISASGKPTETPHLYRALLAAPLLSIYYSVLIQYSYAIHQILARLLREEIEPALTEISHQRPEYELETFYLNHRAPGIRKWFFRVTMLTITFAVAAVMWVNEDISTPSGKLILTLCGLYFILCGGVIYWSDHEPKRASQKARSTVLDLIAAEHRDYPSRAPMAKYPGAIFLDRDGTLNVDGGFTHKVADLQLFRDSVDFLRAVNDLPCHIVILSNQSGIAKNIYSREQMRAFNAKLIQRITSLGSRVDAIYFSPHHEYKEATSFLARLMSKPGPGLLWLAMDELGLDPAQCVFIGDKLSDVAAGQAAGVSTIWVDRKGEGGGSNPPPQVVASLDQAIETVRAMFPPPVG
ncbi:MAG: HAD-IIIA family hydrolase [Chthonomonas sp.]|nr:HAD-IIIA family hydrolase [Chthonomonas sp.]